MNQKDVLKQSCSDSAENVVICPGQDATIHCTVDEENNGKSITLTFGEFSINLNYSQMSQFHYTTEQWRGKTLQLANDGTITIHNLENEDAGIYTCVRVTAQSKQMVLTSVQISSGDALLHLLSLRMIKYENINICK